MIFIMTVYTILEIIFTYYERSWFSTKFKNDRRHIF